MWSSKSINVIYQRSKMKLQGTRDLEPAKLKWNRKCNSKYLKNK